MAHFDAVALFVDVDGIHDVINDLSSSFDAGGFDRKPGTHDQKPAARGREKKMRASPEFCDGVGSASKQFSV